MSAVKRVENGLENAVSESTAAESRFDQLANSKSVRVGVRITVGSAAVAAALLYVGRHEKA